VIPVILGLLAAVANASQALVSKRLTFHYPARQLIGVLFVCNCLVLLPLAPFVPWHWSSEAVVLHVGSGLLLVVTAIAIWDMFDQGAASSTTTASALSPVAAAVFAAVLLPSTLAAADVLAALVVTGASCGRSAGRSARWALVDPVARAAAAAGHGCWRSSRGCRRTSGWEWSRRTSSGRPSRPR